MIFEIIQTAYDATIRERLPRSVKVFNGVPAKAGRLLDLTVDHPEYKAGSVDPLREHVQSGDNVIAVGGGNGVTPVVAARQGADVICYEAGEEQSETVRETAALNKVSDRIEVVHSPVGPVYDGYGDGVRTNGIAPGDLPDVDVLELDCEGAEGDILDGLAFDPRVAIVEAHPQFGVAVGEVEEWFDDREYEIVNRYEHAHDPNVTITGVKEGG